MYYKPTFFFTIYFYFIYMLYTKAQCVFIVISIKLRCSYRREAAFIVILESICMNDGCLLQE